MYAYGSEKSSAIQQQHQELHQGTRELVKHTLRSELFMDAGLLKLFKEELRPMYSAMPKTEHGILEPTVIRYALHRLSVELISWRASG